MQFCCIFKKCETGRWVYNNFSNTSELEGLPWAGKNPNKEGRLLIMKPASHSYRLLAQTRIV